MNDPENTPVDIDEVRSWLNDHKSANRLAWSDIAREIDIPAGTISQFGAGNYAGKNDKIAVAVYRYRQLVETQADLNAAAPEVPDWVDTETSKRIDAVLAWSQRGRITLVVGAPGIGKTMTARRYANSVANVWMATLAPSSSGVATMQVEVLAAMGEKDAKGSPQQLSRRISDRVTGKRGLIIIDEAQEMTPQAINEVRGWHDRTGVGIALLGNEKVVGRIDGGAKAADFAQLASRVSITHVQTHSLPGDIDAIVDAWRIDDKRQREFLHEIGLRPGGLREVTQLIELASVIAIGQGQPLELGHLRQAAKQRRIVIGGGVR